MGQTCGSPASGRAVCRFDSGLSPQRRCSSMVEHLPSKQATRVRFPSPAPTVSHVPPVFFDGSESTRSAAQGSPNSCAVRHYIGMSPSGKARDFDSLIRWFESSHPRHSTRITMVLCAAFRKAWAACNAAGNYMQMGLVWVSVHRERWEGRFKSAHLHKPREPCKVTGMAIT